MFYTGTDRRVWMVQVTPAGQSAPVSLGGQLKGCPAAVWAGGLAVFGRGTNDALWWRHQTASGWSRWASLGGKLTSKPTATWADTFGGGERMVVAVRGTDGAVGLRTYATTQNGPRWSSWWHFGGRLLAGTAPAVALNDLGLSVAAVGTNGALWVALVSYDGPGAGWHSLGGRTMGNPAIATPDNGSDVLFMRGTDNAVWYNQFYRGTPGWHSLRGSFTSAPAALTQQSDPFGPDNQSGQTSVFALDRYGRAWMDSGTWPALSGWTLVRTGERQFRDLCHAFS
jgi:hypothetical protein